MTQYSKPAVLPAWADSGDKTQPTDVEIQTGWPLSMTPPSRQRFNWILYYNMAAARYFAQNGIPEWDAAEDYPLYARVRVGAQTYRSISGTSNIGMSPATEPTFWTAWGVDAAGSAATAFSVGAPTLASHAVRADTSFMPIQSVTATQLTGALTVTVKPTVLNFRSSDLTSGIAAARILSADASLVIPVSATLGVTTTDPAEVLLLLIDNAGVLEVAVINRATTSVLDESGVISTVAITAGSTSANVVYSTTARTNVAYRIVGGLTSVNTAGSWANPSVVWGAGGRGSSTTTTTTGAAAVDITATAAAGDLTVGSPGGSISFHSTSLIDGLSVPITFGAASLVAPSGSTLSIVSASRGRVLVCLINNAGTAELALISQSGGSAGLTEMGLISTTAISAGATSSDVFYSASARTNVAYRVIGVLDVINTAGTWITPAYVSGVYGLVSLTTSPIIGANTIFGYGSNVANLSVTNLVNSLGVVSADVTGVGTVRYGPAAAKYGGDKAIFGYGLNGGPISLTNLVSNTGVVAADVTGVGTARYSLAAASYGTDKALFGYGFNGGTSLSMTNLVNNTGVVATDTTGVGTARHSLAAAGYGS